MLFCGEKFPFRYTPNKFQWFEKVASSKKKKKKKKKVLCSFSYFPHIHFNFSSSPFYNFSSFPFYFPFFPCLSFPFPPLFPSLPSLFPPFPLPSKIFPKLSKCGRLSYPRPPLVTPLMRCDTVAN